jgi:uncharacterized phiE125 gp8 family phage protein
MIETDGPGVVTLGEEDRALAVAAVRAVLRVANDDEDALIAAFVETALGLAEQFLGQMLIVRTLRVPVVGCAAWQRLAVAPVRAITGVETLAGVALRAEAFAVDIDAACEGWVRVVQADAAAQVAVVVSAGLATGWAGLPAPIRQGAILLAAYLFDERDVGRAPPVAVTALWRPFRRIALSQPVHAC